MMALGPTMGAEHELTNKGVATADELPAAAEEF